jgi:hypothetical protein
MTATGIGDLPFAEEPPEVVGAVARDLRGFLEV